MSSSSGTTVQQGGTTQAAGTTSGSSTAPSASQIIAGGSSMFSFFTQLQQSKATARNLESQAIELDTNAKVEEVNARAAANMLRERLNQNLANNAAAFSTAGVDPTSGSARVIADQSVGEANRGFFENDLNSRIKVAALKRQAAQAREDAHAVRKSGRQQFLIGGVTTIARAVAMGA
jgi:hypothetical protein